MQLLEALIQQQAVSTTVAQPELSVSSVSAESTEAQSDTGSTHDKSTSQGFRKPTVGKLKLHVYHSNRFPP